MNVTISPTIFKKFHKQFMTGLIFCTGIDAITHSPDISEMLSDMEDYVQLTFNPDTFKNNQMVSSWETAMAHFGNKFVHYNTNIEPLMQTILDGGVIPRSNTLNDLVSFFSLKTMTPISAFDAKKISGDLLFTLSKGSEIFVHHRRKHDLEKNEIILHDRKSVISRKLHHEVSSRVMVTEKTKNALIVIEAIPPINHQRLSNIVEEFASLIRLFCGGKIQKVILGTKQTTTQF